MFALTLLEINCRYQSRKNEADMNIMKKIVSAVSAFVVASGIAVIPTSAVDTYNYSVSYETLTQALEVTDGSVVPAGSVAVTVSIEGNRGFDANTVVLDIGDDNSAIMDRSGSPVVTKGHDFNDAIIAADSADSLVSVAAAMSETFDDDGELFTIYLDASNPVIENVEILSTDEQSIPTMGIGSLGNGCGTNAFTKPYNGHTYLCYYSGDANDDNLVNAADASLIRSKLNSAGVTYFIVASYNYQNYFPVYFAAQPDADMNGFINDNDAVEILKYATAYAVGNVYTGNAHTLVYGMLLY